MLGFKYPPEAEPEDGKKGCEWSNGRVLRAEERSY